MVDLTCIVCPIGCSLSVEESAAGSGGPAELIIKGNKCPRGGAYAQEEIRAPKRTVTATCAIACGEDGSACNESHAQNSLSALRRIPVKTSSPCPREKIPALLADIYQTKVQLPVKAGDALISNWKGEGIDVVATRTLQ
jgi:CxxC motif-containing protein